MKLFEHLLRAQNVLRICISMKKLQFWQTTSVDVGPLWRVVRKKKRLQIIVARDTLPEGFHKILTIYST